MVRGDPAEYPGLPFGPFWMAFLGPLQVRLRAKDQNFGLAGEVKVLLVTDPTWVNKSEGRDILSCSGDEAAVYIFVIIK